LPTPARSATPSIVISARPDAVRISTAAVENRLLGVVVVGSYRMLGS